MASLCHPWFAATNLSYRFPIFETSAAALCGTTGISIYNITEGSLEVELPTIWTDGKAEVGRVREEKKREDQRRERVRRKKMQVREKVEMSRSTVFLHWFVPPERQKAGSLKGGCAATWPDERWKIARRCGAKRVSKSKCTMHTILGAFLEVEISKKCTPSWREAPLSKSKCTKHFSFGALLEVDISKRCKPLWREPHFHVKMYKTLGPLLKVQMWFCVAGARDSVPYRKWAKPEGLVAFPKTMAGVGHLKRICKDACRVAGAVHKTCSSEMLGGQGSDFLRGVAFWNIRSSGLLRWFCVTGAALRMTWHQFFVAGAILRDMDWKNRKTHWHEVVSSALHSTFHYWRKSRRIASFLMVSISKIEEVSQNTFLKMSSSKVEDVSQNCCVFDVVKLKRWGNLVELLRFQACRWTDKTDRLTDWLTDWQTDRQIDPWMDGWTDRQIDR